MILYDDTSIDILPGHVQIKAKIERFLLTFLKSRENECVYRLVERALFPGRRLRPILLHLLATPNPIQTTNRDLEILALAVELCHRSSIIIDDLIDGDDIRHQTLAHHKIFGEDKTIILSHYLISAVYQQLLSLPEQLDRRAHYLFTEAYRKMALGELADIGAVRPTQNYLSLFEQTVLSKTSALFELVFQLAAILRNLDEYQARLMSEAGRKLGQLYQIYNDIYDDLLSSDTERGGKDRWRMNLTLTKCFLLDNGSDKEKGLILSYLGKHCSTETYYFVKEKLCSTKCSDFAASYGETSHSELMDMLSQINQDDIKETIIRFSKFLTQRKCWDQAEVIFDVQY